MNTPESSTTAKRKMDISYAFPSLTHDGWRGSLRDAINAIMGVNGAYDVFGKASEKNPDNVFLDVIGEMEMTMDRGDLDEMIPATGPAIVIANHPFGGADAIALSGLCIEKRPDTRILANAITAELPGVRQWCISLEILGEDGAIHSNRGAMKEALALLRSGGLLVVFPAGAVSRWRNDLGRVADPEWSPHIARLATKTGTPVLPVRFFGRNPIWFEVLGILHPLLRSALIVRVFLGSVGQRLRFRAGNLVDPEVLHAAGDTQAVSDLLREKVESITEP